MARLTALERERADVVAEINTLRSMQREETEPIKVVPPGNAGDPMDRNSPLSNPDDGRTRPEYLGPVADDATVICNQS